MKKLQNRVAGAAKENSLKINSGGGGFYASQMKAI